MKIKLPCKPLNLLMVCVLIAGIVNAQQVTGVITDYQGFWKSGIGYKNPVKPQNSHNLLAFTFNGIQYSTGVNDILLSQHNELFYAADFRALPVKLIGSNPTSNTKIGLGQLYDGVDNGKSNPSPVNDMQYYLTDGIKGLDLGTGVANIPQGYIEFSINEFFPDAVGDGVPDILITQIADPSSSFDQYEFLDAKGKRVGSRVGINLTNIASVGTWVADFYEASTNPMILTTGFTKTEREIRLWAADFSDFNITPSDVSKIKSFRILLNGNSDLAFVAYNYRTMQVNLPVSFGKTSSRLQNGMVQINWEMLDQSAVQKFVIEESIDGRNYYAVGEVHSLNQNAQYLYNHRMDQQGRRYYRIKAVSVNGIETFSSVLTEEYLKATNFSLFPNPASGWVKINLSGNSFDGTIEIRSVNGSLMHSEKVSAGESVKQISLQGLTPGMYSMVLNTGGKRFTEMLVIR